MALALALGGCASGGSGPSAPPGASVVTGVVDAAPGCPGPESIDSPCPARPVPGAVVDVTSGGTAVTTITTDRSGRFTLRLNPGTYRFTAHNAGGIRSQASVTVAVPASAPVELTVDSGIR